LIDLLLYVSVGMTLVFAFVNGFHDGGNVIATVICSRSMHPLKALVAAAIAECIGPVVLGTAVSQTIFRSIFDTQVLAHLAPTTLFVTIIAGVGGAIAWNLVTWWLSLPSSSSHALIGGLIGAGLATAGAEGVAADKVLRSVVLPLLVAPVIGFVGGSLAFSCIAAVFAQAHRSVGRLFVALQSPCMIFLAASQGSNDAQKSMGVITLALAASAGTLQGNADLPYWAVLGCAAALAAGLSVGGWRIVKTVGYGISRMEPVHSFASQFAASIVILVASLAGGPVSTTQVVSASVMGVGASRRLSGVRWNTARSIAYAWFLTMPASAVLGGCAGWVMIRLLGP